MKLYTQYNDQGQVLVHRIVPDDVTLPAPFVLRSAEDLAALTADQPPPFRGVPEEVALWRIKAITDIMGLTAGIEAALNSLPNPQRAVALRSWTDGNVMLRNSPTVLALAPALNLTSEQVDDLFRQADALEA